MRWRGAAVLLGMAAMAGTPGAPAGTGAESALTRYQTLLTEKRALQRENAILQHEAKIAVTGEPYILFDAQQGRMEFRIRGKTLKSYSFTSVSIDDRGRVPADPEALWRAVEGALTVEEKEGGRPELIPPDPETGREAGLLYSDPNQLAGQTGVKPANTDAGVLGVDVPTDYYIRLEPKVVFHIRTQKDLSLREEAADRLGRLARSLREAFSSLWGGDELPREGRPRIDLYLTTDVDTAKHLHYSLLPGEKLFVAPPPPPPVVLVAAASG